MYRIGDVYLLSPSAWGTAVVPMLILCSIVAVPWVPVGRGLYIPVTSVSGGGPMAVSHAFGSGTWEGRGEARDEAEERSLLVSPGSALAVMDENVEVVRLGECVIAERTDEMIRM